MAYLGGGMYHIHFISALHLSTLTLTLTHTHVVPTCINLSFLPSFLLYLLPSLLSSVNLSLSRSGGAAGVVGTVQDYGDGGSHTTSPWEVRGRNDLFIWFHKEGLYFLYKLSTDAH